MAYVHKKSLTLSAVLQENAEVFKEEFWHLHKHTAKLVIKPDVRSRFCQPRSVPFTLQQPIERELHRMETDGVIEKVTHSKWAGLIVVVFMSDGTVRLCGDY